MDLIDDEQTKSQGASQRFYTLEQLGDLAYTVQLTAEALQTYRTQMAELLSAGKKEQAFEIYRLMERQRDYLAGQIRATRPFLMELENPLAASAQKLAEQLSAFPLMTADYSKLTDVLQRFATALPN